MLKAVTFRAMAVVCALALTATLVAAVLLSGVVRDPSGAVIAGADIEVKSQSTGQISRTTTDNTGRYRISVDSGQYEIRVGRQGFESYNAVITVGTDALTLDLRLKLAARSETVEVAGKGGTAANTDTNYRGLRDAAPTESVSVENLRLVRDAGEFTFKQGTFTFTPPVLGKRPIALFIGEGEFKLAPKLRLERDYLNSVTNKDNVTEAFSKLVLCVTDGTSEEIRGRRQGNGS